MNHNKKRPSITVRNQAYRQALAQLGESLEQNSEHANAELIEHLGRQMFGDLWRPEPSKTEE